MSQQIYATAKGDTRVGPRLELQQDDQDGWARRTALRCGAWCRASVGALRVSLDAQRGTLFVWSPVLVSLGIGVYFALPVEPRPLHYAGAFGGAVFLLLSGRAFGADRAVIPFALCLVLVGFLAAGARANLLAAPVLKARYYGPVEGRVVTIDRSASGAARLTLDHVELHGLPPPDVPARVRISLHGPKTFPPEPGQWIGLTANLSPPAAPAEPRGFDFQRMAWFDRLGAVGYSRAPVIRIAATDDGVGLFLHRLRQSLARDIRRTISGQEGAFAAAILTGDRSAITPETEEALRGANLSHLLAISGLHMGLLTGAVFGAIRLIFLIGFRERAAVSSKKIAAVFALCVGAFYLALSGWNVATERAYTMVSVMYVAVLFDRRAISLRAVALAALIILILRPEVLPEPGFQMSFAATTSLVAAFDALRRVPQLAHLPKPVRIVLAVVVSSFVAGMATAPVAAAHFNRIADYGLIANVLSVPLMGLIIMPMAVFAVVLAPFGAQGIALSVMAPAISWILAVAATVSGWEGAVTHVPTPPSGVLALMALGGVFVVVWRGPVRVIGLAPICVAFALWIGVVRPVLLVSEDGGLVGYMTPQGRVLNKPKGAGFAARTWLENDGDGADQAEAAARDFPALRVGPLRIAHITGRGWQERVKVACAAHDIVIVNQKVELNAVHACEMFDLSKLKTSGALAFHLADGQVVLETTRDVVGRRLWNSPAPARGVSQRKGRAKRHGH
ncbi:ComEC/Rec2 family competence protein [Celeribacter sp.]|uniref:ComEC/Rec2 family competence protein n=1 Tax=Celeribacter sp. TaxID=1890673 RepID=UPI003A95B701